MGKVYDFETSITLDNERRVAERIEQRFRCTVHKLPKYESIDFYAERGGRVVAYIEIKCRTHSSSKYPTVYLSLRKRHALFAHWLSTGVPCLFVVQFSDCTMWIDAAFIGWRPVKVLGYDPVDYDANAREPMIEVPIDELRPLGERR